MESSGWTSAACFCFRWCRHGYSNFQGEGGADGEDAPQVSNLQSLSSAQQGRSSGAGSGAGGGLGNANARVRLDASRAGPDVVLLKHGFRICGSGAALCTQPFTQDKVLSVSTHPHYLPRQFPSIPSLPLLPPLYLLTHLPPPSFHSILSFHSHSSSSCLNIQR